MTQLPISAPTSGPGGRPWHCRCGRLGTLAADLFLRKGLAWLAAGWWAWQAVG